MIQVKLYPAILYKTEIERESQKMMYTEDALFYQGWYGHQSIDVADSDESGSLYQYAICDTKDKLIGYISYRIDLWSRQAYAFGLVSFDRGNVLIGYAVKEVLDKLIHKNKIHRIEFRCVGGNPVKKAYDRFCKRYGGRCIELKDTVRDECGEFHNEYIYEILL